MDTTLRDRQEAHLLKRTLEQVSPYVISLRQNMLVSFIWYTTPATTAKETTGRHRNRSAAVRAHIAEQTPLLRLGARFGAIREAIICWVTTP
jgi:hypothetical protein